MPLLSKVQNPNQPVQQAAPVGNPAYAGIMAGVDANSAGLGLPPISNPAVLGAVKNMGLEGGGVALGQTIGTTAGPAGTVIGGALGGMAGNAAAQLTSDQPFSLGQMVGAGVAGAIPGASLAKMGGRELITQGAKYAGANLAATNIASAIDTGKPASIGQDITAAGAGAVAPVLGKYLDSGVGATNTMNAISEGAPLRSVLKDAKDLNMVIPPVVTNPSLGNKAAHVVAGGSDVINAARAANQPSIVRAVRDELGFLPGQPMSRESINSKIVGTNQVWDKIESLGSDAAFAMNQYKTAMNSGNDALRLVAKSGSGEARNAAIAESKQAFSDAEGAAKTLKQVLTMNKQPGLWDDFQKARVDRAKLELAKDALNADGSITPAVFGHAWEAEAPLTGNLLKLGKVENAFSKYVAANPPTPSGNIFGGVTKLGAGALAGYGAGGIPGAVVGALTVPPITRATILSKAGQSAFTRPNYGSMAPDAAAQVAKYGAMAAGRDGEPLSPEEESLYQELKTRLGK